MDYLNQSPDEPVKPKLKLGPTTSGPLAVDGSKENDFLSASGGHNTFRPDIYRTSEGYLN